MRRARLAALLLLGACGVGPGVEPSDAGDAGAEVPDSGGLDGGDAGDFDAGPVDAGSPDAGKDAGVDAGAGLDAGVDAGPAGPLVYPFAARHSPITEGLAGHLRAIAARAPGQKADVFSKIGDSNTVNTNFVSCFAGANVDLSGRTALQPALDFFKAGQAGTTTPWDRVSLAATVGWSAGNVLAGTPSYLDQELAAVTPRYAVVMFGTNDSQGSVFTFADKMFELIDHLTAAGVVPLLTTMPPRDDSATADALVPQFDGVLHGLAQARQLPLMDLNTSLRALPGHGIGPDGLHLNVYTVGGAARGCVLTSAGLGFGHNVRNLLVLEALDRTWKAVTAKPAPDASGLVQAGSGSLADPFLVPSLPYTDLRDTSKSGSNRLSSYPGCAAAQNESGNEQLYKLVVTAPTAVTIDVFALNGADVDVHLMSDPSSGAGCVLRNDKQLITTLQPGTWWLSLDTYVSGGVPQAGEYLLSITTP